MNTDVITVAPEVKAPEIDIPALAARINAEHEAIGQAVQSGLVHALRAGELLIQARASVSRGKWLPWLKENCTMSQSAAYGYMQLTRRYSELPDSNLQRVGSLSLRQALKLLSETQDEPDSMGVHYSSDSPEWYTPAEIIERTVRLLGAIDLDPCSNSGPTPNVPAVSRFTEGENGLTQPWTGRVYMNPPYGRPIVEWVEKLVSEYEAGGVTEAIALIPARVDTEWYRRFHDCAICFINGRLKFSGHSNSAPFPSAVAYLGGRLDDFHDAFSDMGDVWVRWKK